MKYAIVFSTENQIKPGSNETSSGYEKMAIALAYSIRDCMPNIDMYCGNFTANKLSDLARHHFNRLGVNIVDELMFPEVDVSTFEGKVDNVKNDYYTFNGFLRSYTKDYFAKRLLDQYDYLIYTDIDVLWLKEPKFKFNPIGPVVLVEPMQEWTKKFISSYNNVPVDKNLYFNWVDIINEHNKYLFDIDYASVMYNHESDVVISNRIDESQLEIIEQQIGGYGVDKPAWKDMCAYHYDSLGDFGTMYMLQQTHPEAYKKYMLLFNKVLHLEVNNIPGYWEAMKDMWQ